MFRAWDRLENSKIVPIAGVESVPGVFLEFSRALWEHSKSTVRALFLFSFKVRQAEPKFLSLVVLLTNNSDIWMENGHGHSFKNCSVWCWPALAGLPYSKDDKRKTKRKRPKRSFFTSIPDYFFFIHLFVYSGRVSLSTISIKKHDTLLLSSGLSNLVDCRLGEIPRKYNFGDQTFWA